MVISNLWYLDVKFGLQSFKGKISQKMYKAIKLGGPV